ncbi:hypothetical protein [Rhizobium sp. P007]|uniref:hypothetical protein n=1 Tax=Rhizobium sp. P007 TaxID=285908 RepID=UPI001159AA09|nr:hypothetical protein [Rhizobium sp. P007]CAD7025076.1 hypothetical protein RP007_00578 [Rhizobium sp. P007]
MTTASQPAAWRVSMGATADQNYWHYFGKKPKAIDDGEIWEPLYSASTIESLQRENEALKKDRDFWKEQFQVETRYRIELADRGTLLALTDANSRAEAAEAEVKRLKSERLYILGFNDGWEAAVGEPPEDSQALASTGGEHHAD